MSSTADEGVLSSSSVTVKALNEEIWVEAVALGCILVADRLKNAIKGLRPIDV